MFNFIKIKEYQKLQSDAMDKWTDRKINMRFWYISKSSFVGKLILTIITIDRKLKKKLLVCPSLWDCHVFWYCVGTDHCEASSWWWWDFLYWLLGGEGCSLWHFVDSHHILNIALFLMNLMVHWRLTNSVSWTFQNYRCSLHTHFLFDCWLKLRQACSGVHMIEHKLLSSFNDLSASLFTDK